MYDITHRVLDPERREVIEITVKTKLLELANENECLRTLRLVLTRWAFSTDIGRLAAHSFPGFDLNNLHALQEDPGLIYELSTFGVYGLRITTYPLTSHWEYDDWLIDSDDNSANIWANTDPRSTLWPE